MGGLFGNDRTIFLCQFRSKNSCFSFSFPARRVAELWVTIHRNVKKRIVNRSRNINVSKRFGMRFPHGIPCFPFRKRKHTTSYSVCSSRAVNKSNRVVENRKLRVYPSFFLSFFFLTLAINERSYIFSSWLSFLRERKQNKKKENFVLPRCN